MKPLVGNKNYPITVGILGGGQLGKMMIDAGRKNQNIKFIVLDNIEKACAYPVADNFIVGNFNDEKCLEKIFQPSDFVSFEFENISTEKLAAVEKKTNKYLTPPLSILKISQNRALEKTTLQKLGFDVAPFYKIKNKIDLTQQFKNINAPCILKTCEGGYDGKNQWKIDSIENIADINLLSNTEYVLEKKINFICECSCIAFRSRANENEIVHLPVAENIHQNGILHLSISPARIEDALQKKIIETTKEIMKKLNLFGVLTVEFFVDKNDKILINELAPRPHNSGHFSMNACSQSQFDLHIQCVLEQKLKQPDIKTPCVMLNILGQNAQEVLNHSASQDVYIHWYGKEENKLNRKVGHINFCGNDIDKLIIKAASFYEK